MDRIGEVQMHELVEKAKAMTGLPLVLVGYPIPPHRLNCGDTRIASGTSTEIAKALEVFMIGQLFGKKQANEKFAAGCLARGLTNEAPHVVVEIREPYVVYSNTPGLVAVVVDHNLPPEEGMIETMNVNPISMIGVMGIQDDGKARTLVCEVLAHRNIHIDP